MNVLKNRETIPNFFCFFVEKLARIFDLPKKKTYIILWNGSKYISIMRGTSGIGQGMYGGLGPHALGFLIKTGISVYWLLHT